MGYIVRGRRRARSRQLGEINWTPSAVRSTSRTVAELVMDVTAALAGETAKPADRVKAPMVVKAYVLRFMTRSSLISRRVAFVRRQRLRTLANSWLSSFTHA